MKLRSKAASGSAEHGTSKQKNQDGNELQALKKELKVKDKQIQDLKKKITETATGGYAVIWFENKSIYGVKEYDEEKGALAGLEELLQEVDIGSRPAITSRDTYVYIEEDPAVSDSMKVCSYLLCGLSKETAHKVSGELKARFPVQGQNSVDGGLGAQY